MSNVTKASSSREIEDALMYLPRKTVTDYRRGQVIFVEKQPARELYLIVRGRVKVAVPLDNDQQTVIDIFTTDDFFGETALLGSGVHCERATALDNTALLSWSSSEIEEQAGREPRLGIALLQVLIRRALDYEKRLECFALDRTPERVARAVLRFADRTGTAAADGSVHVPPVTHQLFSEYVGTSREIVTFHMNQLRKNGLLQYTRKGIQVYTRALEEYVRSRTTPNSPWRPPVEGASQSAV